MYLDDEAPIAGGRELWGFPKKLASPSLAVEKDTLLGVLKYGSVPVAVATMGYKHQALDPVPIKAALTAPNFLLKIVPHVEIADPLVKYEFIPMPDSTGFGDYTESGQVTTISPDRKAQS